MKITFPLALLFTLTLRLAAAENTPPAGFRALFNGKDLTGWRLAATKTKPAEEALDGQTATSDGR